VGGALPTEVVSLGADGEDGATVSYMTEGGGIRIKRARGASSQG
jgi:hypothetical protein